MAATSYPEATTPTRSRSPASRRINTPQTPRLGTFGDNWEPYSPAPRKSARISSRTTDNRTPSPNSSARLSRSTQPRALANTSAARTSATSDSQSRASQPTSTDNLSSPPPTLSPQKKRQPASASISASRAVSGSLTAQSIRAAAAALGQSQMMEDPFGAPGASRATSLPTPSKTPAAPKHVEQNGKELKDVSRNLFGADNQEAPLTVKKTRKTRNNSIGFNIFADDAPIEVFTDPENRVPVIDGTAEDPFYGETGIAASATTPPRRSARNKKAAVEKQSVEKNLRREDGLLYTFRGKKVFRKFTDAEAASRAAVAPRLLFPSATAKASMERGIFDDEEEAETDIDIFEEQVTPKKAVTKDEFETPHESEAKDDETTEEKIATPKAPKHAPASPPSTSRATRGSSKKFINDEHTPVKSRRSRSSGGGPFGGWRRTKNSPTSPTSISRKRPGETLHGGAPKRTRA